MEPSAVIPLTLADSKKTKVVIAGDHKQITEKVIVLCLLQFSLITLVSCCHYFCNLVRKTSNYVTKRYIVGSSICTNSSS